MSKPPYDINKENRIKTIKSTTAIENNTLSLKQVTDVINGKLVVGKADEIQEVKNAYIACEKISEYKLSVKKYLNRFVKLNILISTGENKGRKYKLNYEVLKKD